jgi:hypothetical protein
MGLTSNSFGFVAAWDCAKRRCGASRKSAGPIIVKIKTIRLRFFIVQSSCETARWARTAISTAVAAAERW